MLRSTDTLRDVTSPAGGAVSTGSLNISQCEQVTVWFIASGAAAPTNCTVSLCDANGAQIVSNAITVVVGGSTPAFVGEGPTPGVTNAVALGPVPPRIFASGSGGAASTLRIVVLGLPRATFQPIDFPTPIIPEDANTVAHVWWQDGTGLIDTKGNTWTMNGTVPQIARTVTAPGGAGPMGSTLGQYYSLGIGADVLDFASDFSMCAIWISSGSGGHVFMDGNFGASGTGYGMSELNFDTFASTSALTRITFSPAPIIGINVTCGGRAGTTQLAKINLATIQTAAGAKNVQDTTHSAKIGNGVDAGNAAAVSEIMELWFSTTMPSDALFTNIMQVVKSRLRITAW